MLKSRINMKEFQEMDKFEKVNFLDSVDMDKLKISDLLSNE